jgi:hypothetical protein
VRDVLVYTEEDEELVERAFSKKFLKEIATLRRLVGCTIGSLQS